MIIQPAPKDGGIWQHITECGIRTLQDWSYWLKAQHGAELRGLTITDKGDRWLLCLKVKRGDDYLVGWVDGPTFEKTIYFAAFLCDRKEIVWRKDRYPPDMGG